MLNRKHSLESLLKISEAKKGINNPMYGKLGEESPRYGEKHSKEVRTKISMAKTGQILKEEIRAKISESRKGQRIKEETRVKMSAAKQGENHPMKGKNHTLEAKVKMSEARLGLKLTEETKLKMSAAKLGTKHSEEAKAKMFEAKKDKAVKLEVTDILSNEITIYSSMKAAARALGIPQSTISSYFRINQKSPYKKQYIKAEPCISPVDVSFLAVLVGLIDGDGYIFAAELEKNLTDILSLIWS
jgi:hypothetical protein